MADGITTTFSDNVEITAEDMDNIALDLGAPEFAGFSADVRFGNTALNGITAALVSKGILNIDDRCKCTLGSDSKTISVAPGVAVFGDGSKIRITESQTVDIIEVGTNYVYIEKDTIKNTVTIENSLTPPDTDSDYIVMLCQWSGILGDLRCFSQAKAALTTAAYEMVAIEKSISFQLDNSGDDSAYVEIPVTKSSYSYIVLVPDLTENKPCTSFYDINNKNGVCSYYEQFGNDRYDIVSNDLYRKTDIHNSYSVFYSVRFVSLENNTLKLQLYAQRSSGGTWSVTFNQKFLLI